MASCVQTVKSGSNKCLQSDAKHYAVVAAEAGVEAVELLQNGK